ncbi:hypothetical protein BC829DRAFT_389315 [Chytridium lagenaria]|nr:hypothetical protein BC829DRAFT_389315 [Chytridium lagenaria]
MSEGSYNYEAYNNRRSNAVFEGKLRTFLLPIIYAYSGMMLTLRELVFGSRRGQFIDNTVRTARYTLFDFLPKQIIIQFSKFANIYFLFISMLQIVPGMSFEHGAELVTNWQELLWKDLKVGDIILVQEHDIVPADIVVLFSSHQNGSCYIETSNLDGESNLKQKLALPATQTAESPSGNLNQFEGYIDLKGTARGKHTLTINNLLLRGTSLVNTSFVFGVNATKGLKNKSPSLEKITNRIVILMFIFVLFLTTVNTILSVTWENRRNAEKKDHWYLSFGSDTAATFFSYMILYNNMIPISLYVSMEFVKLMEVFYINSDLQMYDSASDTAAQARTSNLHEDLGQVQYVFTDKTGTLTQNIMLFKKMSVSGWSYRHGQADELLKSAAAQSTHRVMKSARHGGVPEVSSETLVKDLISRSSMVSLSDFDPAGKIAFDFLLAISLCHTVEPNRKSSVAGKDKGFSLVLGNRNGSVMAGGTISAEDMAIEYQSSSPDEVALVNAAREMSFILRGRTMTTLTLNTLFSAKDVTFDILHTVEFSSKRKRMSSIYRYPDGRIVLICKGADSVILERLRRTEEMSDKEKEVLEKTLQHLADFATEGLRTLLYASKELSPKEYEDWSKEYEEASLAIKNRTDLMESVAERIESNLTLLGATAIEDKLQVGVPDTIDKLRRAGIKVWMLTGDKRETAINIGYTCQIAKENSDILIVDGNDISSIGANLDKTLEKVLKDIHDQDGGSNRSSFVGRGSQPHKEKSRNTAEEKKGHVHNIVVIDGDCLSKLEEEEMELALTYADNKLPNLLNRFLDLATICDGKALIVSKVRERISAKIQNGTDSTHAINKTLTWGSFQRLFRDGANDIPMLQSAHVGIGITGREGLAASRASDYSIAQFRFLQPLLFVHGRWSYIRVCLFTLGTFYKCFTFYLTQALFQSQWTLTLYNILFSSLPVIIVGIFEKDLNRKLYSYGQYNNGLNFPNFLLWMCQAGWHSVVSVFIPLFMYGGLYVTNESRCLSGNMTTELQESSLYAIGNLTYTIVILLVNVKVCYMDSHNWTIFTHISFGATLIVWWAFTIIYSNLSSIKVAGFSFIGLETASTSNQLKYWLAQFLAVIVSFAFFDATTKIGQWKYDDRKTDPVNLSKKNSIQRRPTNAEREASLNGTKKTSANVAAFVGSGAAAERFAKAVFLAGGHNVDWGASQYNIKSDQEAGKDILHIINVNN